MSRAQIRGKGLRKRVIAQFASSVVPVTAVVSLQYANEVAGQSIDPWLGAGDGTSWNSPANWSTYPPTGDDLYFGAGAIGIINLDGSQTANSVTFTNGFTLDPIAATDTLAITTGSITVSSGTSATINASISTGSGLNISGAGTITLTGANNYAGSTNITGGTLVSDGPSSLSTQSVGVGASGQLTIAVSTQFSSGGITNNGTVDIASGQTLTMGSYFTQNSGTLAINGSMVMAGGEFTYNGGAVTGAVNMGLNSYNSLYLNSTSVSTGTFIFPGNNCYVSAAYPSPTVTIPSGVTISFTPANPGMLNINSAPAVNAGNLNITGSAAATATISTSTLTNTGTLTASATGAPSGIVDYILGNFVNASSGAMYIDADTKIIAIFPPAFINNGTVDIASGQILSISNTFEQNAGTVSISGSLACNSFIDDGGTITGTVTMGGLSSSTLSFGTGQGINGTFVFPGPLGTLGGATPIIPIGVTVKLQPTTAAAQLSGTNPTNDGALEIIGNAGANATLNLNTSTLTNSGTLSTSVTGSPSASADFIVGNVINNSTGTVDITAPTQFSGNVTNNGALLVSANATASQVTGTGTTTVDAGATFTTDFTQSVLVNNGTTILDGPSTIGSLSGNGSLVLGSGGPLTVASISLGSGTIDIGKGLTVITYGNGPDPIASIAAWIKSGYNNGTWTGDGIISSDLQAGGEGAGTYGIGYADSADPGNPANLPSGTIEIMYTLLGDANLDGKVNGTDFTLMATSFNQSGKSWDQGDFNYDGDVNGSDFVLLAENFNQFASQSDISAADLNALDSFAAANRISVASVPEPQMIAMLIFVAGGLSRRRRRMPI